MDSKEKTNRGEYYEKFLITVANLILNIEYFSSLPFSQKVSTITCFTVINFGFSLHCIKDSGNYFN